jgi:hypothetical protein
VKWLRRLLWGLLGIVCFFWIGYEDRTLVTIAGVAVLISFTLGLEAFLKWTERRATGRYVWFLRCMLLGAIAGALVGPVSILLALIKVSLYHQAVPDFSISNMRILLVQTPTWIMAGLLFGIAGGFLKLSQ